MKKFIALILSVFMSFTLFSGCKKQNDDEKLTFKSLTLDQTSVKTEYIVGDTVDFSGIKVKVEYSVSSYDKNLTFADLTLSYDQDLTETDGSKTVTFKYVDVALENVVREGSFTVKVYKSELDKNEYTITAYTAPAVVTERNNVISKAGTASYGSAEFAGQFYADGDTTWYAGDDNAFKFLPVLTGMVFDEETGLPSETTISVFRSVATISVWNETTSTYDVLTAVEGEGDDINCVKYYAGEDLLVTADTIKNEYVFNQTNNIAVGKKFKISVIPASNYVFDGTYTPAIIEVKVIDAYNVYNAKELSVLDNFTGDHTRQYASLGEEDVDANWVAFKSANGITTADVKGIVLQSDIAITSNDIPESFLITTQKTATFTDKDDTNAVADVTITAGTKLLRDGTDVYIRETVGDFRIEGNYFTIDASAIPVVPSHAVFNEGADCHYGDDFSNSTLFRITGKENADETDADKINATINNVAVIGNASRNELRSEVGDKPLSAGGLILVKGVHGDIAFNNVTNNSFFISYFPECGVSTVHSIITLNKVKCYDSYQNAGFIWLNAELVINNSVLENSGGPLFILQHDPDDEDLNGIPKLIVDDNSKLTSLLNGGEFWFASLGAGEKVGQIQALNNVIKALTGNTKTYVNSDDKINIIAISMGRGAIEALEKIDAQAEIKIGSSFTLTRDKNNPFWGAFFVDGSTLKGALTKGSPIFGNGSLTANDVIACDANGTPVYTGTTFASRLDKYISLNQLGLGAVFELYNV